MRLVCTKAQTRLSHIQQKHCPNCGGFNQFNLQQECTSLILYTLTSSLILKLPQKKKEKKPLSQVAARFDRDM